MDKIFILKHKDDEVGVMTFDEYQGLVTAYKPINPELAPYLGNADLAKIKQWWQTRAVPGSREMMLRIIRDAGCDTGYDYLLKNLALSMTDCYWVCPVDLDLKWNEVKLFNQVGQKDAFIPYHNATSYDPNASLGGQMEKYWDLTEDKPRLIKTASGYYGQQAINEEFASILHSMQPMPFPYVKYLTTYRKEDGSAQSLCEAFTSENVEFVSAYEVVESKKMQNDISTYDHFAEVCDSFGLSRDYVRKFLDYQTLSDFLISNTDEHLNNFGILRNADNLKMIAPAPIFDSGNSMFYDERARTPLTRAEILDRKFTGILKKEEKMLQTIKTKDIFDLTCLPTQKDVKDFYILKGLPEDKASFVAANFETKKILTKEFQEGKKISLYNETHPSCDTALKPKKTGR